ncbi:sce7726 family protein [Lysinibacillus sp. Y5S-8]|jgi:hypothetical protein|uniref:sce7726 family protein n=1 Tax=Lysinibacillus sp. Y5S-8 TaxID=3122488 RepID=UPI0030D40905
MEINYLNRFFTKRNLFATLQEKDFQNCSFIEEVSENYKVLSLKYRNEFFYKNTIFNKIVLGKYSLSTTVAYSEVNIVKSKADYIIINNLKATVYEIKTELDNLERLVYQLTDYSKVFNEIFVVTSENLYYPVYKVLKEANLDVGIIVLTKRDRLSIRKNAVNNVCNLNHEALFKLLRKYEYEEILKLKFGEVPNVKPVEYFKASLNWFKALDILEAQRLVFKSISDRKKIKNSVLLKQVPFELRWLVYNECNNDSEVENVLCKLRGD